MLNSMKPLLLLPNESERFVYFNNFLLNEITMQMSLCKLIIVMEFKL
jgi:hypothetical protein